MYPILRKTKVYILFKFFQNFVGLIRSYEAIAPQFSTNDIDLCDLCETPVPLCAATLVIYTDVNPG